MPKTKKSPSKLKSLFTERNLTILLLLLLVACVTVLLTRETMRSVDLIDPANVEQAAPPLEEE